MSDFYGVNIDGTYTDNNGTTFFTTEEGGLFNPYEYVYVGEGSSGGGEEPPYEDPCDIAPDCGCTDYYYNNLQECSPHTPDPGGPDPDIVIPQPETPNPCTQADQQAGTAATNLFNNSAVQDALGDIPPLQIPPPGFPPNNEHSFYIRNEDGNITTSDIDMLSPTGGAPSEPPGPDDIGDLHTHPNSGNPPYAEDVHRLGTIAPDEGYVSIVITAEGTQYALVVTDSQKLSDFMIENGNFVDSSTKSFSLSTSVGVDFSVGMSQFNSAERALAYALRDSGLTLLKAQSPPAPSGNFKKIGAEEKMVDGQIKLVNADCE